MTNLIFLVSLATIYFLLVVILFGVMWEYHVLQPSFFGFVFCNGGAAP